MHIERKANTYYVARFYEIYGYGTTPFIAIRSALKEAYKDHEVYVRELFKPNDTFINAVDNFPVGYRED